MNKLIRSSLLAALLPLALPVFADPPAASSTGLGQSWPASTDVSASSHFHVYQFARAGVQYIQVNDLNGTVRGVFGIVGDQIFALPMGVDATRLLAPADAMPSSAQTSGSEVIYRSDAVQVIAYPQPSGTMMLQAAPGDCNGDPYECGHHLN